MMDSSSGILSDTTLSDTTLSDTTLSDKGNATVLLQTRDLLLCYCASARARACVRAIGGEALQTIKRRTANTAAGDLDCLLMIDTI